MFSLYIPLWMLHLLMSMGLVEQAVTEVKDSNIALPLDARVD